MVHRIIATRSAFLASSFIYGLTVNSYKMSDYEIDNEARCPKCNHSPLHNRDCAELMCNDGFMDEADDDPINFMPGEREYLCPECKGTGVEWWCPSCGHNCSGNVVRDDDDAPGSPDEWLE